jgi:RNA-directed DNA polymerase
MNKNRIGGRQDRTSGREIAKSKSIKGPGCKSGGCAPKAVELTPGDLRRVQNNGLRESREDLTATQRSAEGIVGEETSRPGARSPRPEGSPSQGPNGPQQGKNGEGSRRSDLGSEERQTSQRPLASLERPRGEAPKPAQGWTETPPATNPTESPANTKELMEEVCDEKNLEAALRRVQANKGSAGVDGMTVEELPGYLEEHWPAIRDQLLQGTYRPQPVRRVELEKEGGGVRKLGIPTVVDRLIQQAVMQVLQPRWDPTFSPHSYGFRPGRSAHQAVAQAQQYLAQGYGYVVDIDLEQFFDRINHDKLMGQVAHRVEDKRVRRLIRAYLNAGVMEQGLVRPTEEGAPQGGPLSPLLSNLVLDELDRELQKRGHRYVRYADDANIYVKSERAGRRVMESLKRFITQKLKLRVNEAKSAVARPQERKFLGFSFTNHPDPQRRIAPQARERFQKKIRELTRRTRGVSIERLIEEVASYLRGWRAYFGFCQTPTVLRDLDSWIRRRLRSFIWKQWKAFRRRRRGLVERGVNEQEAAMTAFSSHGPWRISHSKAMQVAFPNSYFDSLGLPRLLTR